MICHVRTVAFMLEIIATTAGNAPTLAAGHIEERPAAALLKFAQQAMQQFGAQHHQASGVRMGEVSSCRSVVHRRILGVDIDTYCYLTLLLTLYTCYVGNTLAVTRL